MQKITGNIGKIVKTRTPFFGHDMAIQGPKTVRKRPFSPTPCFYTSPRICRRFWPEVLTQTPKNAVFLPKVLIQTKKGPNHTLEKVLTNETPGIYLQVTFCDFQHGPNYSVSLESNLLVQMTFHILAKCTHDKPLHLQIVRNSSMSFIMRNCPRSTVVKNPASVQNQITRHCCENLSTRSWYFCNRSSCARSSVQIMCLHHTWHKRWVRLSQHNKSPYSQMEKFTFSTQIWDCSVKTELMNRNNCAKNSFNRSLVNAEVHW